LLLIAVQYPFTLLAITMGGITQTQVSAVYLGLTAYLVLLAGFGLLCSTIGSNNRSAATFMIAGLSVYVLVPLATASVVTYLQRRGMSAAAAHSNSVGPVSRGGFPVLRVSADGWILTTGFGEARFSWQVISNLTAGLLCCGLAWGLFGVFSRQPGRKRSRGPGGAQSQPIPLVFTPAAPGEPAGLEGFLFRLRRTGDDSVRLAFCLGLYVIALFQNGYRSGGPGNLYMDVSFLSGLPVAGGRDRRRPGAVALAA